MTEGQHQHSRSSHALLTELSPYGISPREKVTELSPYDILSVNLFHMINTTIASYHMAMEQSSLEWDIGQARAIQLGGGHQRRSAPKAQRKKTLEVGLFSLFFPNCKFMLTEFQKL